MPQEDDSTSDLYHPEEIFWVEFPADDHATEIMKPGEQALDLPTTSVAAAAPGHLAWLSGCAWSYAEQPTARRSVRESAHPVDRYRKRDHRSSAREFPQGSGTGAW